VYQQNSKKLLIFKKSISIYILVLILNIFINSESLSMYLKNVQTSSEAHPASYSMHIRVISHDKSGWGMTLTTHLHPAASVRISGAVHLLPQYAFMVWTGTTLPLPL
jgi:hypothetical protein